MITHIEIDGFKSFNHFEMDFTPYTVIAGANAAGKSNLFDALHFLSVVASTDKIQKAFRQQRGNLLEVFTRFDDGTVADDMSFVVELLVEPWVTDAWGAKEKLKYTRLRYELSLHRFVNGIGIDDVEVLFERLMTIKHEKDKWVRILPKDTSENWRPPVRSGRRKEPYLDTDRANNRAVVSQDGNQGRKRVFPLNHPTRTVLSSFDSVDFPHILAVKNEMMSWRFLQLNPEDLRRPTSKTNGGDELDETGKNLAATLYRIKQTDSYCLKIISRKLHSFVPSFVSVDVEDDKENNQYVIELTDSQGKKYSSRVLSEGTLRILALCILEQDEKYRGLLCFEEPENGVHPSRINTMANLLKDLTNDFKDPDMPLRQLIVNTHSTVFIHEVRQFLKDSCFSLYFARMARRILFYKEQKMTLLASVFGAVPSKEPDPEIPFPDQEARVSYQMLVEFLEED